LPFAFSYLAKATVEDGFDLTTTASELGSEEFPH